MFVVDPRTMALFQATLTKLQMTLTVLFSLLHVIIHTSSNLIAPEEDASKFTADEVQERIYGSKLTIITEQMQIMTIWLLKACILTMYGRMT